MAFRQRENIHNDPAEKKIRVAATEEIMYRVFELTK